MSSVSSVDFLFSLSPIFSKHNFQSENKINKSSKVISIWKRSQNFRSVCSSTFDGISYSLFHSPFLRRHYHSMEVFATFNIYNSTGHRVAEGHKASFCLEDNQCLDGVQPRYACADFGDQGNSISIDMMWS